MHCFKTKNRLIQAIQSIQSFGSSIGYKAQNIKRALYEVGRFIYIFILINYIYIFKVKGETWHGTIATLFYHDQKLSGCTKLPYGGKESTLNQRRTKEPTQNKPKPLVTWFK